MSAAKPSRGLVVAAGILTQLTGACCLLLGTVAFALTLQGKEHALTPILIGWIVAALSSVVCGGLIYRGSLASLVVATLLDGLFGVVLLQLRTTLGGLLRMLSASDVEMVAGVVGGMAIGMLVAALACLLAIPQARRYATWLDDSEPGSAASTVRGFPPPPVSARSIPTAQLKQARRSRRRLVFAIAGLAIGIGSGIAVISTTTRTSGEPAGRDGRDDPKPTVDPKASKPDARPRPDAKPDGRPDAGIDARVDRNQAEPTTTGPIATPQDLLIAEHTAIGKGDLHALAQLASEHAFVFGVDAAELADGHGGRDAIEAILRHDLGEAPKDGFAVDGKYLQLGEWRDHAWIAEELEVTGKTTRRYAITQLVAKLDGRWTVEAWCWAIGVADGVAERLAHDHTMPAPRAIADERDGPDDLDAAFRAAVSSRMAFSDAFSIREDAFNFGSAPGEHVAGGTLVRKIFSHLPSDLEVVGGVHVVGGNTWDKSQATKVWIGWAAANVAYKAPNRATQVFRVLAVLIRDPQWKVVQSQFSNGGPIP